MKRIAIRVLLLAGVLIAGARAVAPETFHFAAGDLIVQAKPALPGGQLTLPLGPFGELAWTTHTGPLNLRASFLLSDPTGQGLPSPDQVRDLRLVLLMRKLPWLILAGALAGALLTDGAWRRRLKAMGIGAGALLAAVGISGAIVAATFDASRLAEPSYRGPIQDAPRILQLLKEVQRDWTGINRNINRAVSGLQRLHTQVVTDQPAPETETVRLLLISDIHNNPLGLLITEELARQFEVDGVLNAGDFTDRGTELEGELFARFGDLGLPQVIAPGNHEDRATVERAARIPDTFVLGLDGTSTTIAGLKVIGEADPNAFFIDSDPRNELAEERIPVLCEGLRASFAEEQPQILLVHDPRLGECAARQAEEDGALLVFAWGHLHEPAFEQRGTVLSVSSGTSGAAGFKSDVVLPYGFALLEFDAASLEPVSVCIFEFTSPSRVHETSCHIVAGRLAPRDAPAAPTPDATATPAPSPSPA